MPTGADAQGGDPLGDLVGHPADGLDLRVEHLVDRDEVRADDVPVDVLEGQRQVVQRVEPVLQDAGDLGALLDRHRRHGVLRQRLGHESLHVRSCSDWAIYPGWTRVRPVRVCRHMSERRHQRARHRAARSMRSARCRAGSAASIFAGRRLLRLAVADSGGGLTAGTGPRTVPGAVPASGRGRPSARPPSPAARSAARTARHQPEQLHAAGEGQQGAACVVVAVPHIHQATRSGMHQIASPAVISTE